MIKVILLFILSSIHHFVFSQQIFIHKGKIEFEKQVNIHKELEEENEDGEEDNVWVQNMKKTIPKLQTTYYNLYFNDNKTLYKAGKEATQGTQKIPEWLSDNSLENIIYNDLESKKTISQKTVYSNTFLLQDSIRKINWKITNDSRMIAGIECRKAIGIIFDSIYVFAFYTDIITCSGGPESFTGLPGMILGIAIPRINTYWLATKIEVIQSAETFIIEPKKGKKITYSELEKQIHKATKDWGKESKRIIWKALI